MRITIDNLDGAGPLDYTCAVPADAKGGSSLTVQRGLNVPSRCTLELVDGACGLALPVRFARVVVSSDAGGLLFTGYLATEPVRVYAGETTSGVVYRARLSAVSDEWLLDKLGSGGGAYDNTSLGLTGQALLARLASRLAGGAATLPVAAGAGTPQSTGVYVPSPTAPWSANAGVAASAAYAGYRALNGQVVLQSAGGVTHALSDADGTLSIAEFQTSNLRELANDVTLSGAEEPAAYIEEVFVGDGTTALFELGRAAFRTTHRTLLLDSFNTAALDLSQWTAHDPGSYLSITSAGLTMSGGNGLDGQTTLSAADVFEMGGSIVAQLGGVVLGAASDGMLAGMYEGTPVLANCFAGFRVKQSSGVNVLVPVVNGAEVGTTFTPVTGHSYTLRLRLHCVEMQRVMQRYYTMVEGVVQGFGSVSGVVAPMDVVFELVDEGAASNTPATVLYDSVAAGGTIASSPATCQFVVVNATQLIGSIGSVSVTRPGSLWIVSTLPGGAKQTRLIGSAGQGVDCRASYGTQAGSRASITFFAGRVPVAGELVSVFYRGESRSVARLANAASIAAEARGGTSGVARWLGKVLQPVARSSDDLESAAQAVLASATSRDAALTGTYVAINPAQDIWPGDVLAITSEGVTTSLLVRKVTAKDGGAVPEVLTYEISFANDWAAEWADGIGLRLSEAIATDVDLPQTAETSPGQVLANLQQLAVTSLTTTMIAVDTGQVPPTGGGFEVRRSDGPFGVGSDGVDLVLRSPVRAFSIPRAAQLEQYFIRMYDNNTPPLYSRFSSAVFVNAPVS